MYVQWQKEGVISFSFRKIRRKAIDKFMQQIGTFITFWVIAQPGIERFLTVQEAPGSNPGNPAFFRQITFPFIIKFLVFNQQLANYPLKQTHKSNLLINNI